MVKIIIHMIVNAFIKLFVNMAVNIGGRYLCGIHIYDVPTGA